MLTFPCLLLFSEAQKPNSGLGIRIVDVPRLRVRTHTGTHTRATCNEHKRRTSMAIPSAGFEPTIPAIERPQTYSLDLMATGIGLMLTVRRLKLT